MEITRESLIFTPSLDELLSSRDNSGLTVFSGPNNHGKSLILQMIRRRSGRETYFLGANRFFFVNRFSTMDRNPRELDDFETNYSVQYDQGQTNYEQNFLDLQRVVSNLNDTQRDTLFKLCSEILGNKFSLKKVSEDNELSMRYIDMDGQNVVVGSSGARILLTILGICLDTRFNTILIDEPELGLGPKAQHVFAKLIQDPSKRRKYFPHIKRFFITTHSHIFLDRSDIKNNFVVSKKKLKISIEQVQTMNDFHKLQFNLLGNNLETMFLPSSIVVVEGKTDLSYIERIIQTRFPDKKITVIPGQGDVKTKVYGLKEALGGDLTRSPFKNRIFVVLDSIHEPTLVSELISLGIDRAKIIEWSKNGIEFFYPVNLLCEIFSCSRNDLVNMVVKEDVVEVGTISKRKSDLNKEILSRLQINTILPSEVLRKLINPLIEAIS